MAGTPLPQLLPTRVGDTVGHELQRPGADQIIESIALEDGWAAAVEAAESGLPGYELIAVQLATVRALSADLAERLASDDPFARTPSDPFTATARDAALMPSLTDNAAARPTSEQLHEVASAAHRTMNCLGAVRAQALARHARWGTADGSVWGPHVEHPRGHRDEYAADLIATLLDLGTHEADSMVDESVWMVARTPRLLAEVASGAANLTTTAAIARELQDARPETCEQVEDVALRRGIHRRPRTAARKATRALVESVEATAARQTLRRTRAQQTGVWLDSHTTPGLTQLSACLASAEAVALMTAVDERAHHTHRTADDGRTLGEHRAEALVELALQNVTFSAQIAVVAPLLRNCAHERDDLTERVGTPRAADTDSTDGIHRTAGTHGHEGPDGSGAEASWLCAGRPQPVRVLTATQAAEEWREALRGVTLGFVAGSAVPAQQLIATLGPRSSRVRTEQVTADGLREVGQASTVESNYRPSESLRRNVIRRDATCRFPGCSRPAQYADLDHVQPWPSGPTAATNLQCLCRRHHRAKQSRWSVTMTDTGTCTWQHPNGIVATTEAGLVQLLGDLAAIRAGISSRSP